MNYDPIHGSGRLFVGDEMIDTADVCSVWLRRFVPPNLVYLERDLREYCEREYTDFFQGVEYAFENALWVSKPSAIEYTRNKPRQLRLAKQLEFQLPETCFTNSPHSLEEFALAGESIYKSIRSPRVPVSTERHTSVFTTLLDESVLKQKEGIMTCPGIVQRLVKKMADIRVTIFGDVAYSVLIHSQDTERTKLDFRNGGRYLQYETHALPVDIQSNCVRLVQRCGLLYGAIDLALMEDGSYVFFEINPNGQWGWLEMKTKLPMRRALLDILFHHHF
ncbi:MAG: hypothetical protein AAB664_04535 [Patescibacteria group bacterium]